MQIKGEKSKRKLKPHYNDTSALAGVSPARFIYDAKSLLNPCLRQTFHFKSLVRFANPKDSRLIGVWHYMTFFLFAYPNHPRT
jgi:hypothetical protein